MTWYGERTDIMIMNGAERRFFVYNERSPHIHVSSCCLYCRGPHWIYERTNERNNHKRNDINKTMSQDNTVITSDANVVSIMSVEPHDIPSVADIRGVAVPKPKKSKRASQRSVTKRGLLGDDDNLTFTKHPIDNDNSLTSLWNQH